MNKQLATRWKEKPALRGRDLEQTPFGHFRAHLFHFLLKRSHWSDGRTDITFKECTQTNATAVRPGLLSHHVITLPWNERGCHPDHLICSQTLDNLSPLSPPHCPQASVGRHQSASRGFDLHSLTTFHMTKTIWAGRPQEVGRNSILHVNLHLLWERTLKTEAAPGCFPVAGPAQTNLCRQLQIYGKTPHGY